MWVLWKIIQFVHCKDLSCLNGLRSELAAEWWAFCVMSWNCTFE